MRSQAIPFKGPPMLVHRPSGFALAEMPAIAFWLGETHGLLPAGLNGKALSLKVVNDANDVIDELSLDGGKQMWSTQRWREFLPRLKRWMAIWEETGRRHGLTPSRVTCWAITRRASPTSSRPRCGARWATASRPSATCWPPRRPPSPAWYAGWRTTPGSPTSRACRASSSATAIAAATSEVDAARHQPPRGAGLIRGPSGRMPDLAEIGMTLIIL